MSNTAIHILIIEDELIIADHLKSNLEGMGYIVAGIAGSFEASVKLIGNLPINLVLIDIQLEGEKTGIDVAHYLRNKYRHIPFIFLSSFVDKVTLEKAKATFPAGYITKPFTFTSIYSMIEITLHNAGVSEK